MSPVSRLLRRYLIKGRILLGFEEPLPWAPTRAGLRALYPGVSDGDFEVLYRASLIDGEWSRVLAFLLYMRERGEIEVTGSAASDPFDRVMLAYDLGRVVLAYTIRKHLLPRDILYYRSMRSLVADLRAEGAPLEDA